MKNQTTKSEWARAKGLLADLRAAARNSVAAQILLGKELSLLKRNLGFEGSGRRPKEKPQLAVFVRNWEQWCQEELGISSDTADRYIACFRYALERAKVQKSKEPEAFRLLETPSAELTGDELGLLAGHVGRLVKADGGDETPLTQSQILEELGIIKPSQTLKGGPTTKFKNAPDIVTSSDLAAVIFPAITRRLGEVQKRLTNIKGLDNYENMLDDLELDSSSDGKSSLRGVEMCLELVLEGYLPQVLKTIREAIVRKEQHVSDAAEKAGEPVKSVRSTRKKFLTNSRK